MVLRPRPIGEAGEKSDSERGRQNGRTERFRFRFRFRTGWRQSPGEQETCRGGGVEGCEGNGRGEFKLN